MPSSDFYHVRNVNFRVDTHRNGTNRSLLPATEQTELNFLVANHSSGDDAITLESLNHSRNYSDVGVSYSAAGGEIVDSYFLIGYLILNFV